MLAVTLATIGCVCGVLGFVASFVTGVWVVGKAHSTHQIQYQPLPDLPDIEETPFVHKPENDPMLTKAEREAEAHRKRMVTDFAELFPSMADDEQ